MKFLDSVERSPFLLPVLEQYQAYFAGNVATQKAKRLDLNLFVSFLSLRLEKQPAALKLREWTHKETDAFVEWCLMREAPATVRRRLATLKHAGNVIGATLGKQNPAKFVKPPKEPSPIPRGLAAEEVSTLLARAKYLAATGNYVERRNAFLCKLMLGTGLRADETRLLKLGQIDVKREWIKRVRCKGRTYRDVYIRSHLRPKLESYLEARKRALQDYYLRLSPLADAEYPLFLSCYGAEPLEPESFFMSPKTLYRAISDLSPGIHPHLLRHTFAHELLAKTGDIRLVAQALGHSDIKITMRYTERGEADLMRAMEL